MSVTFEDGPAAGAELALRSAPIYMRVVIDETSGKVDALDQAGDTPNVGELVHVYRRATYSGAAHVCYRGKRKRESGWYVMASYTHVAEVDGESVRMNEAWRQWCLSRPEARPRAEDVAPA